MGKVFTYLGMSTGCINNDQDDHERKNHLCDITYATNNELGFDYLRDNMKYEINEMVQRSHNYCIVDEVDSILLMSPEPINNLRKAGRQNYFIHQIQ